MTTANRMLRRPEVEAMTGLSTSTPYAKMSAGTFPRGIKVGVRAVRWSEREIKEWLAQRPRYGE